MNLDLNAAPVPIGFPFKGSLITNPWLSECSRFPAHPQDYGFEHVGTGGGCTAWQLIVGEDLFLVTDLDASAPDTPAAGWMLGCYEALTGDPLWCLTVHDDGGAILDLSNALEVLMEDVEQELIFESRAERARLIAEAEGGAS